VVRGAEIATIDSSDAARLNAKPGAKPGLCSYPGMKAKTCLFRHLCKSIILFNRWQSL
jgi:hypothetical protein